MVLDGVLKFLFGVAMGVLVSIPVALVIAMSTVKTRPRQHIADLGAAWQQPQSTSIVIEAPGRELMQIEAPQ